MTDPYDSPERMPNRRDRTTIWRDGQVIRRDGWGRVRVWPSVPDMREQPAGAVSGQNKRETL